MLLFFFFQAEDGIRDYDVTGVQTCALPILRKPAVLLASNNSFWFNEPLPSCLPGQGASWVRRHAGLLWSTELKEIFVRPEKDF